MSDLSNVHILKKATEETQESIPGVESPDKVSNLHVVAMTVKGSKETSTIEIVIRGDLQTNNLEMVGNMDYYKAFHNLAQSFYHY